MTTATLGYGAKYNPESPLTQTSSADSHKVIIIQRVERLGERTGLWSFRLCSLRRGGRGGEVGDKFNEGGH